jgi:hypothetical protein
MEQLFVFELLFGSRQHRTFKIHNILFFLPWTFLGVRTFPFDKQVIFQNKVQFDRQYSNSTVWVHP